MAKFLGNKLEVTINEESISYLVYAAYECEVRGKYSQRVADFESFEIDNKVNVIAKLNEMYKLTNLEELGA